jgi:hypothetical protein
MRVFTVATDSMLNSVEDEELEPETRIWKAIVRSEPPEFDPVELEELELVPLVSIRPSPDITKPDGSMGMIDESSPLIATFMAGMPTGAYTTIDTEESVQLSCSISMLFSAGMKGCFNLIEKFFSKLALINFLRMNQDIVILGISAIFYTPE